MPRLTASSFDLKPFGYVIGDHVGAGATGTVFKGQYVGEHPRGALQPQQQVALKFVKAEQLYPREVLMQARVQHPNITKIFDVLPCVPAPMRDGDALGACEFVPHAARTCRGYPSTCSTLWATCHSILVMHTTHLPCC